MLGSHLKDARRTVEQTAARITEAAGDTKRSIVVVGLVAVVALGAALLALAITIGAALGHRKAVRAA